MLWSMAGVLPGTAAPTPFPHGSRIASAALAVVALLLLPGGSLAAGGVDLTESASGTTVHVAAGTAIVITLESNASTGYHWLEASKPASAVLAEAADSGAYVAPKSTLIGAAGQQVFRYVAAADGTTSLVLHYVAPGTGAVGRTFRLTIAVGATVQPVPVPAGTAPPTSTVATVPTVPTDPTGFAPLALVALGAAGLLALVAFRRRMAR